MSTSEKELQAFRAEVAAWMKANNPADPGFLLPQTFMEVGDEQQLEFLREWQHKVWAAGYLGMAWPKQYGGGGVDPIDPNSPTGKEMITAKGSMKLSYCPTSTKYTNPITTRKM